MYIQRKRETDRRMAYSPCLSAVLSTAMATDPLIVAAAVLCLLLHLLLRRLRPKSSSLPLPPGPRGFPIVGALPLIGPAAHSSLARLARRYGPIMYLKMGTCGAVVASSATAARAFLKTHDAHFADRPDHISTRDITYNRQTLVFADYSPRWKLLRKLLSRHMLGPRALADWAPIRRAEAGHMVRDLLEKSLRGEVAVVPETLVCATANIIGQVMLSSRVFAAQGEAFNGFKDMIGELLTGGGLFNIGDFVPAIAWMDLQGVQAKMKRIHLKYDALVTRMLADHAATAHQRRDRPDFIDLVVANRVGDDGVSLTDVNIKGIIFDIFTAGTDTASVVIEWALAEMIRNPLIMQRLQHELDDVVGRHRRLDESDIPKLPYLQAVCKEALRLHPSTPLSLPHYTSAGCEVAGFYIPPDTRLLVNVYAIGRDPDVWADPERFDPDRFISGEGARIEPMGNDFELIPFGAGRRICAGKQAGMVFVQYFLGTLVHAFDWAVPDAEGLNMDETPGLALPKAVPLAAMVTPRLLPSAYE